jgi:phosphonate transport system permease protein
VIHAGERTAFRWVLGLAVAAAVAGAFRGAGFDPGALVGERAAAGAERFFSGCWPPRTDGEFLLRLAGATADTVATAAVGTAFALVVGLPLGIVGSRAFLLGAQFATGDVRASPLPRAAWVAARAASAVFRSVPDVVWALLFVRVTGLGALPAVAALGVAYGGLLGKVFSEQIEDVAVRPVAALEATGAGRVSAFLWGTLPQAFGPMASYAAYRFECAIRASALMGFVGAGGLGFQIEVSSSDSLYGEVLTETAFLVAVVAAVEWASDAMRRRLA